MSSYAALYLKRRGYDNQGTGDEEDGTGDEEDVEAVATPATVDVFYPTIRSPAPRSRVSISVQHPPDRPELPQPPSRRPPVQMPPRVDYSTLETRLLPGPRVRVDPVQDTSHPRAVITMHSALSTPMRQPARVACDWRRVEGGVSSRGDSRTGTGRMPPRMGGAIDRSIVGEVSFATRRSTSSMVSRLIAESVRKMQQKRWMHTGAVTDDDATGDNEGRRPMRGREGRSSALSLSSALGESLQQVFDGQRLRVGGKGITRIDRVSERMAGAVVAMYMGDNDLRDVTGIMQFANVRTLSLANNLLRRLEDIEPLKELRFLESLVLEGNPVVREAGYRLYVIGTLSNTLKILDGDAVTEVERKEAPGAVRRVRAFCHEGFKHTCRILQLEHVTKLLAVHEELREVLYGSSRSAPSGSLSSLLRGTEDRNPAHVVERMLDLWPFESWAWAYPHLRDIVEEELRRELAEAMESGRGTCWELCLGQVLLQQQEALSVLAERAEALIEAARAWALEQSAASAGPVRSSGRQTAATARKPKNPQTPTTSREMKLQAPHTTAGNQPQPTANAALTDRHTIHRRYTTLLRQRHGGPKVIRPRKQPGTTQTPATVHSLFHDADVSAIRMQDTSELSADSMPLVAPAVPMVFSPPNSPREHTSLPRRPPRISVPRKPPAVADTSTRRLVFSAGAAAGGKGLEPRLPPPPEAPPPPAQGPRPPHSSSAASTLPLRDMQRAMSGVSGGCAPESLTPSLPPQQREPEEEDEGEGPREILPVVLVGNLSEGAKLEAASREPNVLPIDIQDTAPFFKFTMDGRLPPPARPMGVCTTVKGLQEQVGAMQKDLASRVKVEVSLYNMSRTLRKRLSETRKRRLDEMDMADRHVTMAEAELERLREGIKSLTLRVKEVERSERDAVQLEAGLEEVSQLADAEAESARRAEQFMVRATDERRRLIQRLERSSAELTYLRSEFCTDEALATAEHALRSCDRADKFRRQCLRLQRHRSFTPRSVIMLFKEFCGRLRYSRQLRLKLSRVDRVRSGSKTLMIFRRWRRAMLRDRACRSCMASYRHRVQRYVLGAWWRQWTLCGAVRNLAQRRLTPLVVVAFKRLRSSAITRRTRREIVQLVRRRRVARRCLTVWQTHVSKLRYKNPTELRLADARALGLRQRILWRRWLSFIRCEASAAERVRRVVETRLRPFMLSRTFARWRYQASVRHMRTRPRWSTQLTMPREADARRVRAVRLLLLVLQRWHSRLLKEALGRWAAWVRRCDQRDVILPRLAKAFERRAMRYCMKLWKAGIRYRLRREQLLRRAWRRQARTVAKRIVREWARAACMSKRLRRGLEILHHVVRRRLLRRGRRRWAAIMHATPRGHDEVDVWMEAKLRAMRRRSGKVWMAALFMRWRACARRRRKAQRAIVMIELLQRTWRMRRVFTAWMFSQVESALAMVMQRRADTAQQQRWHLSLSQSLCEEDERITAAECQVVALQGHMIQMAAELAHRQTELREARSQTEREQARTEGLRFRVEMLKDEIEAKKQEIQDVRAGAEGGDSWSASIAAADAAGTDSIGGELTLQDGRSNPSPEEFPFVMEEMTQKERELQQRIEKVMAEETWLQQALHEREVTKGPTAAMVQDQISMARQFRLEFDQCCIEAEALEHEKQEMQERLQACMRALDRAQAEMAAQRRSSTIAKFTKESAVLEKQLKTARKKFVGQVDRRRRDVGQSTAVALRAQHGRRVASSPPHREEHLFMSCASDSEPNQSLQTAANGLPGTLTPPAPTRKVEVLSPVGSSKLGASSFADRGEDLSLRAELEEARALNAYLEASLRGSHFQQMTLPAATVRGSPERSYTRDMQQVEGLESEIAADILKLQRRVEERFAASRRRPA